MNQTRVFLLFAWITVATLLYMEWNKEEVAAAAPAQLGTSTSAPAATSAPGHGAGQAATNTAATTKYTVQMRVSRRV